MYLDAVLVGLQPTQGSSFENAFSETCVVLCCLVFL